MEEVPEGILVFPLIISLSREYNFFTQDKFKYVLKFLKNVIFSKNVISNSIQHLLKIDPELPTMRKGGI